MAKIEETLQNERSTIVFQAEGAESKKLVIEGLDAQLVNDLAMIDKYCESVNVYDMLVKELTNFVEQFRNKDEKAVHLKKCQFLASDYRYSQTAQKFALPMEIEDNEMIDALLVYANLTYALLFIPCISKEQDRFWFVDTKIVRNIQELEQFQTNT